MVKGLEEILAPALVTRVPEACLEHSAGGGPLAGVDGSGRDHDEVDPRRLQHDAGCLARSRCHGPRCTPWRRLIVRAHLSASRVGFDEA